MYICSQMRRGGVITIRIVSSRECHQRSIIIFVIALNCFLYGFIHVDARYTNLQLAACAMIASFRKTGSQLTTCMSITCARLYESRSKIVQNDIWHETHRRNFGPYIIQRLHHTLTNDDDDTCISSAARPIA